MKLTSIKIVAVLLLLTFSRQAMADVVLVKNNKGLATIVLQDKDASEIIKFAASELQRYIEEMSGAKLQILSEPSDMNAVFVLALTTPKKNVDNGSLNDERHLDRYMLKTSKGRVEITGASPRAVLYGVYDLLERLGCGWCVPGDDTVPKKSTLTVNDLDIDTQPAFQNRMVLDFPLLTAAQSIAIVDWIAKNRMNWVHPAANAQGEPIVWYERRDVVVPQIKKRGVHVIFGGHTMHTWIDHSQENFQKHPDWFSMIDGVRKPVTLCVSNQEVCDTLIASIRKFLDKCPEAEIVDVWHTDGRAFCHCPKCTSGLLSDGNVPAGMPLPLLNSAYSINHNIFANKVANAIAQSHPGVMTSFLVYGPLDIPVSDASPVLADNIIIGMAHIFRDSYFPIIDSQTKSSKNIRFLANDISWMAKSKNNYVYEYYNAWRPPFIYPGTRVIVDDLKLFHELGMQGSSADTCGWTPINMYVAARVLWDPNVDWKEGIRDYCRRYFGDVAEEMANNQIRLENEIYGKKGYLANGAAAEGVLDRINKECGEYIKSQRPGQIEFLKGLIGRTKDPLVKTRLERELKPWDIFGGPTDDRFWAYPEFKDEVLNKDVPTNVLVPELQK